jgi:hypothetical protein
MSVYKIVCLNPLITDVYVGSTNNFMKRCAEHKSACKRAKNKMKVYCCIRANGDWVNWKIEQLEVVEGDRQQLLIRERHWFNILKSNLNSNTPTQTNKEWYVKNKEKKALYYIANKDRILKRMAECRISKQRLVCGSLETLD